MSVGPIAPPPGGQGVTPIATNSGDGSPGVAIPQTHPPGVPATIAAAPTAAEAAVAAAAAEAALTQDGLAPLLADLAAAQNVSTVPQAARATIQQILATQAPLAGDVTAQGLRAAVEISGLFLEAALAAAVQHPDQAAATSVPNLANDLKALLLRLSADLAPAIESQITALQEDQTPSSARPQIQARRAGLRPAPPIRGAAPAGQAAASPSLGLETDAQNTPRILRQDAQAALARLQLSQLASLPKADGAALWSFELPIATWAGPAIAQFEISRDGAGTRTAEGAQPAWRARFSLDADPGGPVYADISLSGGRTRVTLWAEREDARRDLDADRGDLQAALAGPEGADAAVRVLAGAPAPAPFSPAGHFLDRTS